MMPRHASPSACARALVIPLTIVAAGLLVAPEPADAGRGFRAVFSGARAASRATSSAGHAAGRAVRSAEEVATAKRFESRIDWSEAGKKGLEVVKSAIEHAMQSGQSSSSLTSSSASAYTSSTLSIMELEGCVREAKWLDDQSDDHDARSARAKQHKDELEHLSGEIDAARSRIDRSSQRSVNAFNARIEDYRQRVSYYNTIVVADLERGRTAYNARVGQFNGYCNAKRYYADDLAEVEGRVGFKLTQ